MENTENKKPRRGRRRRVGYKVEEEALLYMIAYEGMLDCLRGVKDTPEGKVYYFERVPDVAEIIERYETEKEEFLYA